MHSEATVAAALQLADDGLRAGEIGRRLGLPRETVRDWLRARNEHGDGRHVTRFKLRPEKLPLDYAYLLGLYLGDGCLSPHPRGVFRLRIVLDARYPGIIEECAEAIRAVRPAARVNVWPRRQSRAVDVSAYWMQWPALFPQHGPGRKHERRIALEPWQQRLVDLAPGLLVRGLIHSDGCRFVNTGRKGWRHPRYSFVNRSPDIRAIFCAACDRLGVHWTTAPHTVYVSRKDDVRLLDRLVGPKA